MSALEPRLAGVVLCGGQSRRMGRPKAWLPFGGETLLARIVGRVREAAGPVVVVAAPGQDVPDLPRDVAVVRDPVLGLGPLQGIAVGLDAVAGAADAAFVSATDIPFLAPAFIRRLEALRRAGRYDVVVARADGHDHPLAAVYATAVRAHLRELIEARRLRPSFAFERVRTLVAEPELLLADPALRAADPELRSLRNVNEPSDYEAALRDAGLGS